MFDVIYTPQAEMQLRKTAKDYQTAVNYVEGIRDALAEIRNNPRIASLTNSRKWRERGLRKVHYKHYYAYFIIDEAENVMRVTVVVYDGMDQEAFLEKHVRKF
ncbi:MAG: type II toxin-antitoxin system RelE/ParE family toxin [Eubacterium sp.]|nr:type II toxin-antitoxin system RelE/ParE family toxin [Eubacterium sp.]